MSTILLVDDETELLELYAEVLEQMGHRVLSACDGVEALEQAWEQRPDLVVTDWMMPRMDGVELCYNLLSAEALHSIPIILHSSSGNPQAPGIYAFLPKSCGLQCFEQVVSSALTSARRGRGASLTALQLAWAAPRA